jgi:hypothetical protein
MLHLPLESSTDGIKPDRLRRRIATTAQVRALGLLLKAPNTALPIQSPWVAIMNRQTEIARKLAAELALPPAQRNRAALAVRDTVPPNDEWGF